MKTEDDPASDFISAVPPVSEDSGSGSAPTDHTGSASASDAHPSSASGSPTKLQHQQQQQVPKRTVCDHCRRRRTYSLPSLSYSFLPCIGYAMDEPTLAIPRHVNGRPVAGVVLA